MRLALSLFGDDSDELETAFYAANPQQKTRFLEPQQLVEIPDIETAKVVEPEAVDDDVIEVWE
uniref:Uncharacterized protein n=1 Tax=Vibrio tasmaniensis TaxID=212663 RepID=A0A0H3ZQK4_9VIBR|nr:hypothetical protein [Vibrio tasmaniensis]